MKYSIRWTDAQCLSSFFLNVWIVILSTTCAGREFQIFTTLLKKKSFASFYLKRLPMILKSLMWNNFRERRKNVTYTITHYILPLQLIPQLTPPPPLLTPPPPKTLLTLPPLPPSPSQRIIYICWMLHMLKDKSTGCLLQITRIYFFLCVCLFVWVCVPVCANVCVCVCVCVRVCTCTCVCVCVCVCVYS